jgi:hypothetical protein
MGETGNHLPGSRFRVLQAACREDDHTATRPSARRVDERYTAIWACSLAGPPCLSSPSWRAGAIPWGFPARTPRPSMIRETRRTRPGKQERTAHRKWRSHQSPMARATSLRFPPTGLRSLPTRACRFHAKTRRAFCPTADRSGTAAAPCSTAEAARRGSPAGTASVQWTSACSFPATTRVPSRIAGVSGTAAAGRSTARATIPPGPALTTSACRWRDVCPSPAAPTPGAGSTAAARSATAAVASSTAAGRARATDSLAGTTCASMPAAAANPTMRVRWTQCPHRLRCRRPRRLLLARPHLHCQQRIRRAAAEWVRASGTRRRPPRERSAGVAVCLPIGGGLVKLRVGCKWPPRTTARK